MLQNANATLAQKKAEQNLSKLAEKHNRELENLHMQSLEWVRKLYQKHALELEIEHLRGAVQVMTHLQAGGDEEVDDNLAASKHKLKEKERELEDLVARNQDLHNGL